MNKAEMKAFAIKARKNLITSVLEKAQMYGISKSKTSLTQYINLNKAEYAAQLQKQVETSDVLTFAQEIAGIWFNRLAAIWFMEVNGYLPCENFFSRFTNGSFQVLPQEGYTIEEEQEFHDLVQCGDTKEQAAAQVVFLRICHQLGHCFPQLFSVSVQPCELLLPNFDRDSILYDFLSLPKSDFDLRDGGQVEIIGWLYQYFNTERKDETFALLQKNIKITKERIPAATQLFTPDWIVRYMVENSLGRLWLEQHPNKELESKWTYYLKPAQKIDHTQNTLLRPQDLTLLDPCMGSGHILVYAFDVLMDIYCAQGYTKKQAANEIIEHNLYGLEIDDAVCQLAHFAVMMKARFYNETMLDVHHQVHLCSIQESNDIPDHVRELLWRQFPMLLQEELLAIDLVIDLFCDAKTYGSLLQVTKRYEPQFYLQVADKLDTIVVDSKINLNMEQWTVVNGWFPLLKALLNQAALLSQTYLVTITNPPYMGKKSLNKKISTFLDKQYANGKSELYAAFILRCEAFTKPNGCFSMVTMHTWMFLTSFQKLREALLKHHMILSMVHAGAAAFEELNAFNVLVTAFVIQKMEPNHETALFIRLTDYLSTAEKMEQYFHSQNYYYMEQSQFYNVPGVPLVYWASPKAIEAFQTGTPLHRLAVPRVGMQTGNNSLFVRYWHEIDVTTFYDKAKTLTDAIASGAKWFPYHKGGNFRKWYGMNEYVVDWENGGEALRRYQGAVLRNEGDYFKPGITWSLFGFENFAVRYKNEGFLFDVSGSSLFPLEEQTGEILGFLCSKVAFYFLSLLAPTVNFQAGNVGDLPVLPLGEHRAAINQMVKENCELSKEDWDSFETSWNFKRHPFVQALSKNSGLRIESCYQIWEREANSRYQTIKQNEEDMNRIFISLYGLEGSLTPEVVKRDIAISRADQARDVKLFLSYLVGCLFGRYHPAHDGIWFAGGQWEGQHESNIAAEQNILLLTQTGEHGVQPDLAELLVQLIAHLYGEEQLEKNLLFLANALEQDSAHAKQTLRNYLWKDFYKDHVRLYQKHPIYWQLDSGKQGGFKALFYIHRANADCFKMILDHYLQPSIKRLERQMELSSEQEQAAAKQQEKRAHKLKELSIYKKAYQSSLIKLAAMTLDDGIKQNYHQFQHITCTDEFGQEHMVSLFSKL